jgi:hypothetical protein
VENLGYFGCDGRLSGALSPMSAMSMMITPSALVIQFTGEGVLPAYRFPNTQTPSESVVAVVRNAYVVRQRKVHAIAGGNIVVSPLEPRAVKRQFVKYVVDHRIRHGLIRPEQRIAE